jgi:hypothetical protein
MATSNVVQFAVGTQSEPMIINIIDMVIIMQGENVEGLPRRALLRHVWPRPNRLEMALPIRKIYPLSDLRRL